MKKLLVALACAAMAGAASAQPILGNNAAYWQAKSACWASLGHAEDAQWDSRTARIALGNAQAIERALAGGTAGLSVAGETSIYSRKMWPSGVPNQGRPKWLTDLQVIEGAVEAYRARRCRTAHSACLEVAAESVWENMQESEGARWNHGRPEIDAALALASQAQADMEANCRAPMVATVPALPVALPPPPAPIVIQRTLAADVLFDFGSAKLTRKGREAVDALAAELAGAGVSAVAIAGHADRFGSRSSNITLSARRAQAVRVEMQSKIGPGEYHTTGLGDSSPVVTCEGKRSASVIACLAPNRRVEVEAK
jgi:outer membrane protein OmpA-like peptidoglycan-associated protein